MNKIKNEIQLFSIRKNVKSGIIIDNKPHWIDKEIYLSEISGHDMELFLQSRSKTDIEIIELWEIQGEEKKIASY